MKLVTYWTFAKLKIVRYNPLRSSHMRTYTLKWKPLQVHPAGSFAFCSQGLLLRIVLCRLVCWFLNLGHRRT